MKKYGIKDKKLGHKVRNYVNDLNHKIAKELVQIAKRMRKAIVIEKLKGLILTLCKIIEKLNL